MADRYQLPPVKEEISRLLQIRNRIVLSKVERHDNAILTLATHIRKVIDGEESLKFTTDATSAEGGVYTVNYKKMVRYVKQAFSNPSYGDNPQQFKVICWRNDTVAHYNGIIRQTLYGDEASKMKFLQDERVVATHPIVDLSTLGGDLKMAMSTDEEATVQSIDIVQHPIYRDLTCYELLMATDYGDSTAVKAYVIHESSQAEYDKKLGQLADDAKARKGSWASFWALKNELIMDIRPCHAITAHRSQGSTYRNTFVDVEDIMGNRNKTEALKCLYVAVTRASRNAVLMTR